MGEDRATTLSNPYAKILTERRQTITLVWDSLNEQNDATTIGICHMLKQELIE